jgi:hypothetical protein
MNYTDEYLKEAAEITGLLDQHSIEKMIDIICTIRQKAVQLRDLIIPEISA